MLSKQSNKFFTKKNYLIYKKYLKSRNLRSFIKLICLGIIPRPHYALGALFAAHQAKYFNHKSFTLIEFGCWNNEGLIDLDHWCNEIKILLGINYKIYGFDSGKGLPSSKNKFDVKYKWSNSDYKSSNSYNLKKFKNIKLILGDVKKTLPMFLKTSNENSPIGFISFDMDYYSSTTNAFKILKSNSKNFIARPILYFDDFVLTSNFEGEYLAINDFNKLNRAKISPIGELAEQLSIKWKKWIFLAKRFRVFTNFKHKFYSERYENIIYKEIINL